MNRDALRALLNRNARLARYSFGFRPIVVPFEANSNSPIADPSCLSMGEGEAGRTMLAVSPECFLNLHEVPCA